MPRLPLLLALLKRVSAGECTFTITDNACTATDCKSGNDGYYLQDGYLLYYKNDAKNPTCTIDKNPLPGYYMDKEKNTKVIKCTYSGCDKIDKPTISKRVDSCTSEHDGKLTFVGPITSSTVKLCTQINKFTDGNFNSILDKNYAGITFAEIGAEENSEERFLVHQATAGEVFSFDRSPDNTYYVVKTTTDSIVLDIAYNKVDYCSDTSAKMMDRLQDFCSANSSGMYYTCENGKCIAESQLDNTKKANTDLCSCTTAGKKTGCDTDGSTYDGYYSYNNALFSISSTKNCASETSPAPGYYWNKHQYNEVSECNGSTCTKSTVPVEITKSCDGHANKIIDIGYNIYFCLDARTPIQLIPPPLAAAVSRKRSGPSEPELVVPGIAGTAFKDPSKYYILKIAENKITVDTDDTNGHESCTGFSDRKIAIHGFSVSITPKILPTCVSEAAKCGLSLSTYCITDGTGILKMAGDACTVMSMSVHDYFIFKETATKNEFVKVDESAVDTTSYYLIYQAGAQETAGTVQQVKGRQLYLGNKLMQCRNSGVCMAIATKGLYFSEKGLKVDGSVASTDNLKPVSCDGERCDLASPLVLGVYYANGRVYRCKSTGCVMETVDTDVAGNVKLAGQKVQLYTDSWKDIIDITAGETKYLKVEAAFGNHLISDNNVLFLKVTDSYIVKMTPKAGYYLNGARTQASDTFIYCSVDDDISKCNTMTTVPGYYSIPGVTETDNTYVKCDGSSCHEVTETMISTCGRKTGTTQLSNCDRGASSSSECRSGAVEGEVCLRTSDGKLYESGKGYCFEYLDREYQARLQYFNAKGKRVLPQSYNTKEPIIYVCEKGNLPTCGSESSGCKNSLGGSVEYCKTAGGGIKKTDDGKCVDYEPEWGELLGCEPLNHELPPCEVSADQPICMDEGYCIHSDDKLYGNVKEDCTKVDVTTGKEIWYFDKQFKRIDESTITTDTYIYTGYYATSVEDDTWTKIPEKAVGEIVRLAPNTIEMCTGTGESIPLIQTTEQTYHSIEAGASKFAGLSADTYTIKSTGDSIVKIDTTAAALAECSAEDGNDKIDDVGNSLVCSNTADVYCYHDTSKSITTKASGTTCKKITRTDDVKAAVSYFDAQGKIPTTIADNTIAVAYTCDYTDKKAGNCALLKGYFTPDGTKVVACNGIDGDTCVVSTPKSCTSGADGYLGKDGSGSNSICVGSKAISLPTEPGYIAYKSPSRNFMYGLSQNAIVVLRVGADFVSVASKVEKLIKCTLTAGAISSSCSSISPLTSLDNPRIYYEDAISPKNIIKCTCVAQCDVNTGSCTCKTQCEKVTVVDDNLASGTKKIYIDASAGKKIITCTGGGTCVSGAGDKIYLNADNGKQIINCTEGSNCVAETYVGVKNDQTTSGTNIQCNGSTACKVATPADATTLKYDTSSGHYFFFDSGSNSWADLDTKTGYEILSAADAKKLFDLDQVTLVTVSKQVIEKGSMARLAWSNWHGQTTMVKLTWPDYHGQTTMARLRFHTFFNAYFILSVGAGYYPRPTGAKKALIRCTGTTASTCEMVDSSSKGYYLFGGSSNEYVKCDGNCSIESTSGDCSTADNVGKVTESEEDLKMCISTTQSVPLAVTDDAYYTFALGSGSFPGGSGTISVKVGKDGSVTQLTGAGSALPVCNGTKDNQCSKDNGSNAVPNCITAASGGVIKKSGTGSCTVVKGPKGEKAFLYYKSDNSEITNPTTTTTDIAFAYECTFKNAVAAAETQDEAQSCTQIIGYKVRESPAASAINCNGLTNCVIHTLGSCQSTDVGKLGLDGSTAAVCFGTSNKKKLSDDDKTRATLAFYTSGHNEWYGHYGIILLKVSATTVEYTDTAAAGYYVNENVPAKALAKALIYCTGTGIGSCKVVDASPGYYASAIPNYYIACSASSGCEKKKIEHASCGLKDVVITVVVTVITVINIEGVLPTCDTEGPLSNGLCSEDINNSHCIYQGRIFKNVVEGQSKSCTLAVPVDTSSSTVKFYFKKDHTVNGATSNVRSYYACHYDSSGISNCVMEREPYPKQCTSDSESTTSVCYENANANTICISPAGYLMKSNPSAGTSQKKCEKLTFTAESMVYLSSSFTQTDAAGMAYTYRCKSSGKCTAEYQKAGGIVIGPKMCGSKDDHDLIDINGNTPTYHKINVDTFPGYTTAQTNLKVKVTGSKGLIEINELASLPACTSKPTSSDKCKAKSGYVSYCIYGDDVIYKSSTSSCSQVSVDGGEAIFFFNNDGEKVTADGSETIHYAYKCTNVDGVQCTLARGYLFASVNVINCSGWKGDECTLVNDYYSSSTAACTSGRGEGGMNANGKEICFGTTKVSLPADGKTYAAFTTAEAVNRRYGIQKEDGIIFLELTPTAVLLSTYTGNDVLYLLDQRNRENKNGATPIIRCTASAGCRVMASGTKDKETGEAGATVEAGIAHTYYIDGAYPFADHIIRCTQSVKNSQGVITTAGTCESMTPGVVDYFVDSAVPGQLITCTINGNGIGYGNLVVCKNDAGEAECVSSANVGEHCTKDGMLFETSGENRCDYVKTCQSSVSPFGIYATYSSTEGEKIIRCGKYGGASDITCRYYADVAITSDASCKDGETAKNDGKIGFASGKFKTCAATKQKELNRDRHGHGYVLLSASEAGLLFEGATTGMFVENNGNWMVESDIRDGYFLNQEVNDRKMQAQPVIQCSKQRGCEKVAIDDLHCTNNHNKLPTCTNIVENKQCIAGAETDSYCIKEGKLYRTVNEDTVKCKLVRTHETCTNTSSGAACMASAGEGTVCLKEGKSYLSLSADCVGVDSLPECTNTDDGAKCREDAEDGKYCRANGKLYRTSGDNCSEISTLPDGVGKVTYYFDANHKLKEFGSATDTANTDNFASVYKCKNRQGNLSECEKSVRQPGELIFTQNGNVDTRRYEVCTSKGYVIGLDRNVDYKTIPMSSVEGFQGVVIPGRKTVRFGKDHVTLIRDRDYLPECELDKTNSRGCIAGGINVSYCVKENTMYESVNGQCSKITGPTSKEVFKYFTSAERMVAEGDVTVKTALAFVYKCSINASGNTCRAVRGYVKINEELLVHCTNWQSQCSITTLNSKDTQCTESEHGSISGDGKDICFYDDEISIESIQLPSSGTEYVAFKAYTTNGIYGRQENDVIILSLTSRAVMLVTDGDEIVKGYHQNHIVVGRMEEALIYCPETGALDKCHVVDGLNGYYLNSDDDAKTYQVIRCEEYLGCQKRSVDNTSCKGGYLAKIGNAVKVCKNTSTGSAYTLANNSTALPTYDYVSYVDASFPGTIEDNKPFIKVGNDGSVTLLEDGIFRNEAVNGVVNNALYECTTINTDTTCTKKTAYYGYYRNAATVGYKDAFLACSVNGCENMNVDGDAVCTENTIGQLVGWQLSPTLCLDYDQSMDKAESITLSGTPKNPKKYMVGYQKDNVFGSQENDYALVNVTYDTVTRQSTDYIEYVYTVGYEVHSGTCANTFDQKTLNEFHISDQNVYGIYQLNCEDGEEKSNLCTKINGEEEDDDDNPTQ
ncbi:hypothetical protein PIROE2DRAFT_2194 [Piromyces sp. E2]|nr:hypothetical protein PIROE2DRAFT_2194 [Piromyces sp. E2]|eukprot:OUM69772.1 hypothetical protein PIROE2DRAFT_2194 [Piromyces sp. E2]